MRVPLRTSLVLAALVGLSLPDVSGAQVRPPGADRWVPSLAITSGFSAGGVSGSVESFDGAGQELRPPAEGRDYDVSPLLGADLELMSPELPLPLSPRLFVSGEITALFGRKRNVASEGNASGAEPPVVANPPGQPIPGFSFPADAYRGLGSSTLAQKQALTFGAGAGLAFPLDWLDRDMRLKISAEYMSFEVGYDGLVVDAVCLPDGATTSCVPYQPIGELPSPGFTREIALQDSASNRYHAVGPSIELELDTGAFKAFTHSLYIGARGYRVIGDRAARSTSLSDTRSYDDVIGQETYTADWDYKIDRWTYSFVVGLRLSFTGR